MTGEQIQNSGKIAKKITKILLYMFGSFLLALLFVFLMHQRSLKVVAQWKQPANVTYDGGTYYMSIVEDDLDWSHLPFGVDRNYFIYLGRDSGTPIHGHMIKYSFHPSYPDDSSHLEAFLAKAKVEWTAEGVTLELPSGHRLFVPKAMFVGGR